jgi:hypothetical protein
MKTPEFYEKRDIKAILDSHAPALWHFSPRMSGYGASGVSDIIGCYCNKFFAIEVKRPGKEPTPIQWRRMNEIEEAGGKTFWGTAEKVIGEFEAWVA